VTSDLPDLLRCVWLSRSDLPPSGRHAFLLWWLQSGRHEYPEVATLVPPDAFTDLFLPGMDGSSPLALALWKQRPDLQLVMPADCDDHADRLTAWLFVHAVTEYDLAPLIGPAVKDWLCQTADDDTTVRLAQLVRLLRPDLASKAGRTLSDWFTTHGIGELGLAPLLSDSFRCDLALRLPEIVLSMRPDVPADWDAAPPMAWWPDISPFRQEGAAFCTALLAAPRPRVVAWIVLAGLVELNLCDLLSRHDQDALMAPIAADEDITPLMALAWYGREDIRTTFDITTRSGRKDLVNWFGDAWKRREIPLAGALPHPVAKPPSRPALGRPRRHGVNLVGYARGELGIGEDVRCMALALDQAGVPFTVINLDFKRHFRSSDQLLGAHIGKERLYDTNIFCLPGFDTTWAYAWLGPEFFSGARNIGNWPWELPVWPKPWEFALNYVDEFWGISRFCTECFAASTTKPVLWMPSAVRPLAPPTLGRDDLGLPQGPFLFTVVFDWNSRLDRKNPAGAITAFEQAFGDSGDALLAIKVMNADPADERWQAFRQRALANPAIRLFGEIWSYDRVMALVAASDCLVSLHRAEGFGRCLAEAMALGVPVIATGWSGSSDLITDGCGLAVDYHLVPIPPGAYPYAEGQFWAEPSIAHAAQRMREIVASEELRRRTAERGRAHVLARHSIGAAGERYRQRLEALWD